MTEQNTFNFDNIGQGLSPIFNSTKNFLQGNNNVLQASAGFGKEFNYNQINTQNNTLQNNTLDSKDIFGETLKTETHIPEAYGNTFKETNNIENNNFITNSTNADNNKIFAEVKVIPSNTTDINNYFSQNQGIQGYQGTENYNNVKYGETQVLPETNSNTFFTQNQIGETNNQINYEQIPSLSTESQNIYTTYQTPGMENINNSNLGTTETQISYNPIVENKTSQQIIQQTPSPQYQNIQNFEQIDYEAYPASNGPKISQSPQRIVKAPSSQPVPFFQTTETNVTSYPYQEKVQNNIITNPPQIISQNYQNFANTDINQYQTQENKIPRNKSTISKLIEDEDFRRGRPIYSDIIRPSNKLKVMDNRITYKARNMNYHENIGLSRLAPSMSYDRFGQINSSINSNINSTIQNNVNNQINQINQVNNNVISNVNNIGNNVGNAINNVNNNINAGLDKITKASSYNVGPQSITPILNNVGLNQNNTSPEINKNENLKNFF